MIYPLGQRLRELPGPMLVTGHTGFKGTWLTFLLEHLDVPVVGYSLLPEKDSLYDRTERKGAIPEEFSDIRNYEVLERFIDLHKPTTIIHMAAQPLVLKSYETPRETFDVNVMGTVNVLDIAFKKKFVKAIIVVTTDKVYRNDNSGRSFIESDPLEGKDPYSASKVGTEAVVAAWQQISKFSTGPKVISARAGNVIGGGDFAKDRIIPDLIRGFISKKQVLIRNPQNTRPWQHVLDPLFGYLLAIESLLTDLPVLNLNFGPSSKSLPVCKLVEIASTVIPDLAKLVALQESPEGNSEAGSLELNASLSSDHIGWNPTWDQEAAIKKTLVWWEKYISHKENPKKLCLDDVREFITLNLKN